MRSKRHRPVVADQGARRCPARRTWAGGPRPRRSGETPPPPVGPVQPDPELVQVGHVVPHPLVTGPTTVTGPASSGPTEQLEDPVDVVGAPVVDGAAGHRDLRVPGPARVLEAAHEGLDVEDVAQQPGVDHPADGHEVRVPAPVLVDREHPAGVAGGGDQLGRPRPRSGTAASRTRRACRPAAAGGPGGVEGGRSGHHHDLDVVVGQQLVDGGVRPHARESRPRPPCGDPALVSHVATNSSPGVERAASPW